MDVFDYSFILKMIILFVLSMLAIFGCYMILKKISHKSGFWCYSYDFPFTGKDIIEEDIKTSIVNGFCLDFSK